MKPNHSNSDIKKPITEERLQVLKSAILESVRNSVHPAHLKKTKCLIKKLEVEWSQ